MYTEILTRVQMQHVGQYSQSEERANTLSHGLGALLSIVALIILLTSAVKSGEVDRIVSFSIYGLSLILLFTASTLYHGSTKLQLKKLFKLFDHCAIYLLIAGSYTPLMALGLGGTLGYSMLTLIWLIALAGIAFKVKFGHKYKILSVSTYLGMGFISLAIMNQLYQSLSTGGLTLLAVGGGIYTFGVFFYLQKKIPFNHAIWHLFVLAGATCHFFMMLFYV
jgi:hemolysin III